MVEKVEVNVVEDGQMILLFWATSKETGSWPFLSSFEFLLKIRVIRMERRNHLTRCHKNSRRKNT